MLDKLFCHYNVLQATSQQRQWWRFWEIRKAESTWRECSWLQEAWCLLSQKTKIYPASTFSLLLPTLTGTVHQSHWYTQETAVVPADLQQCLCFIGMSHNCRLHKRICQIFPKIIKNSIYIVQWAVCQHMMLLRYGCHRVRILAWGPFPIPLSLSRFTSCLLYTVLS